MIPGRRLIILLLLGAFLLLFIPGADWALMLLAVYNSLLLILLVTDFLLTPKPLTVRLERIFEDKMSLGAENPVSIVIANKSGVSLYLTVKDEPPLYHFFLAGQNSPVLDTAGCTQSLTVAPGVECSFTYRLVPQKRGDYRFGAVNLRYRSRLGLFLRQAKSDVSRKDIKVYPNLLDIRRYSLLAQKGHLQETGTKPAVVKGLGTDYEGVRDYVPGDEFRRINWPATARRGKLVTNEYQDEKSQNIIVVLDCGRMMTAPVEHFSKLDMAINAGLLLGYVGISHDDKVGLLAFDKKVKLFLPPKKGKGQLNKIISALYNIHPNVVESNYREACYYLKEKNRKRSLVCFFTDLIDHEASLEMIRYTATIAKNHLVLCITLIDSGLVSKAAKIPASSREVYEKAVAESVLHQREKAIALLRNQGVVVINVPPEELSIASVNKYLEIKALGRL